MFQSFTQNTAGRDFAVGDIHGHFSLLMADLRKRGFDPAVDRLFSVGDLVDRGPENEQALEWLEKPWFHAVRGNHEQMLYDAVYFGATVDHRINGGEWFHGLPDDLRKEFADRLVALPLAIEVATAAGLVGLIHADCPFPSWATLRACLQSTLTSREASAVEATCLWSRSRIKHEDTRGVEGLHGMLVGHTPLEQVRALGNVIYIDTAGWLPDDGGQFSLIDLNDVAGLMAGSLTELNP